MKSLLPNTDFYKYMHRVFIFTAFLILIIFTVLLNREDTKPNNAEAKEHEAASITAAEENTPPPTQKTYQYTKSRLYTGPRRIAGNTGF